MRISRRPNPLIWISTWVVFLWVCVPAPAQTTQPESQESELDFQDTFLEGLLGEEYTSTGARRDQRLFTSASSLTVLDDQQLDAYPGLYLGDFLALVVGLDVRWGQMQRYYIGARGLGGTALNSRMLLLWNGQPLNAPMTGELDAGHFVPLADVERIEVIRGPGSSVYGANAFSGVVNIITKSQTGVHLGEKPKASLLIGSHLTRQAKVSYGQALGPVGLSLSAQAFGTQGSFPEMQIDRQLGSETFKNDDARYGTLSASMTWKGLRVSGTYVEGERGRPGQFPTDKNGKILACASCHNRSSPFGDGQKYPTTKTSCGGCHAQPNDREYIKRAFASISYETTIASQVDISAKVFHNEWHTDYRVVRSQVYLNEPEASELTLQQRTSGAELSAQHTLGQTNKIIVGASAQRNEVASQLLVRQDGENHATEEKAALFVEDEYRPVDWLFLTLGGRLDYSSLFGVALTPRGSIVTTPTDASVLRATFAQAFRNPSFNELYLRDERGRYVVTGNPDLLPENNTTFEVSAAYVIKTPLLLRFQATGFHTMAEDLIGFRAIEEGLASFYNYDQATSYGVEFQTHAQWGPNPKIEAILSYAYTKSFDEHDRRLPYAPESKINLSLNVAKDAWNLGLWVRLVSERFDNMGEQLPTFVTIDASARYNIYKGFGLRLWLKNAADQLYQESLGIPAARRSFFFVLDYQTY